MENYCYWAWKAENVLDQLDFWQCVNPTDEESKSPGFTCKD